jgi:Na+/melibiose symporter-like transporter
LSASARVPALAPFRIRSFRFQWPADLTTSWAFEMETLILGWYVLTETGSVFLLALFASLQYGGTLISPFVGVVADRVGHGAVLATMRATYAMLATIIMTLALLGMLTPLYVFAVATLMGLVRPSDMGMRTALVGDTIPTEHLMGAMGISRTTGDSARVAGALTGAGLVATLGMGPAYVVIAGLYATSFLLTLKIARMRAARATSAHARFAAQSPWREIRDAAAYVWATPPLLGTLCLAFLVNFCAYPVTSGLLPYVAKNVYGTDQTGLGYLVAGFASGALVGSIVMTRRGSTMRPARMMLTFCGLWYLMLLVFAQMNSLSAAIVALFFTGCVQSLGMVPMAALLLRNSDVRCIAP